MAGARIGTISRTTPNGPMTAWVPQGQPSPSRYITPSGCTIRSQPRAGSQDGSSRTSHMAPGTRRRPGKVVRATSQAMGKPSVTPSTAAALLTHSELTTATAVAVVNRLVQVGQREPLAALAGPAYRARR